MGECLCRAWIKRPGSTGSPGAVRRVRLWPVTLCGRRSRKPHYIGLLPWPLVKDNRMGLRSLTVKYQTQWISVGLITIKNHTLSPLADRFIACVRDVRRLLTTSTKGFKPE